MHTHFTDNYVYFWVALGMTVLLGIFGIFTRSTVRKSPINFLVMILWTLSFGMVLIYASTIAKDAVTGLMLFTLLSTLVLGQFIYTLTVRYELTY
jgi:predicted membrane channel-forming protein YqfA (hemolysin III family)